LARTDRINENIYRVLQGRLQLYLSFLTLYSSELICICFPSVCTVCTVSVFLAIYRAMRDSSTSEVYGARCGNLIAAVLSELFSDILSVFSRISIMTNVCSGTKTVICRTMMTEWRKLSNF
jgi:hypothetical protein